MSKDSDKAEYLLTKNIKRLNKESFDWKSWLVGATKDENLVGQMNSKQQMVIKYKIGTEEILVSGSENPKDTAKLIVAKEFDNKIQRKRFKAATTALAFSLDPYVVEELLAKYTWVKDFFVVFPSLNYFAALLTVYDFSKIFKNKSFRPIFNNDVDALKNIITVMLANSSYTRTGLMMFSYSSFERIFKDLYLDCRDAVRTVTNLLEVNLNTSFLLGKHMDTNILRHLDKLYKYPTVKAIKDKLQGKPVVCVAAGPSLLKNIEYLKKIQDEVFIISIAATAEILLKNGIRPDLLTIIDMQPLVLDQLKDVDVRGIPVVIEMTCHHSVVETVNADFIFSLSPVTTKTYLLPLLHTMGLRITPEDYISSGLTVAITSLMCAIRMGASEIILVGQDLAVTATKSHFDGYSQGFDVEIMDGDNGQKILKQTSVSTGEASLLHVKEVDGYYGDKVYTTMSLDVFLNYFKGIIKEYNLTNIYNATEGGAFIDGCTHIPLKEAYNKLIKKNKLDKKNICFDLKVKKTKKDIKQGKQNLKLVVEKMEDASNLAKEGLDLLQEYMKRVRKETKEKFDELWLEVAVGKINKIAEELNTKYAYEVNAISQLNDTNYYLFHLINNINNTDYTEEELRADMENKFVLFFANIHESLNELVKELQEVIERVDKEYLKKKTEGNNNV